MKTKDKKKLVLIGIKKKGDKGFHIRSVKPAVPETIGVRTYT